MEFFTAGRLGEMFVSLAFSSAMVAMISFWMAERRVELEKHSWEKMGKASFGLHIFSILGIIATIFFLIYQHRYEYHYVWDHSSNELPVHFIISCFWEGQEGSFLLWCFWHSVLGGIIMTAKNEWRNGVLAVIASIEVILVSMLLGAYFFGIKLGSSPFMLLKDVFPDHEIYQSNPDFIPANGSGLNSLLQNYWMVIHPPTLFLGFASTIVPFAYVITGLLKGKYQEWIRPAMPWMSFSVMILGVGIIMGGYWAYETLNFGGYWNWDPVENSSFVPWLCGVAGLHSMLIYQKSKAYLKLSMMLIIGTFLLVLYSTFLTRSDILGDTSVHAFTDLGLSGQLVILMGIYFTAVTVLLALNWKKIPQREDESKVWSAEFMLFLGVLIFAFSGLIIILSTSLPVFNKIFGTDMAPPPQVQLFYYNWTVWFAILFGVVSGLGQFLWWKIGKKKKLSDAIFRPFLLAVITGSAAILLLMFSNWEFAYDEVYKQMIDPEVVGTSVLAKIIAYIKYGVLSAADELLLYATLFGFFANMDVLIALLRKNRKGLKIMGGTIVHIGFALMLLGMLFSSGYDEVLSKNISPANFANSPMSEQEKLDNSLLPRWHTTRIKDYDVRYVGRKEAVPPVSNLEIVTEEGNYFKLSFEDASGETWAIEEPRSPFLKKETSDVSPSSDKSGTSTGHNSSQLGGEIDLELVERILNSNLAAFNPKMINDRTLYGIEFINLKDTADKFVLYPETEIDNKQKTILPHPSRKILWDKDIYVYTSSLPDPESLEPRFYSSELKVGEVVQLEDGISMMLAEVRNVTQQPEMQKYDIAAAAYVVVFTETDTFGAQPVFLIEGNVPGMKEDLIPELGMEVAFVGVQPDKDLISLQVKRVDPRADYITVKVIKKPLINLLWLGTFILTFGFLISIYRRVKESRRLSSGTGKG